MGFAVVVGTSLVSSLDVSVSFILGFVTAFALTGASMAVNDYYDRDIDAINEPKRPIPSGMVNPKEALLLALVLSVIGLLAAYSTNLSCFIIALIAWVISFSYVTRGKRTGFLGNFLVSMCVAIPFVYGGLVVEKLELSIVIFAAIVFLSNMGREIAKGIVDVRGDARKHIRTVAVLRGERDAAFVSSIFFLSAVALSPFPWLWELVSDWFLPPVLLTDIGLVASSFWLMHDHSRDNARRVKNLILVWFITGLLGFLVGRLLK
jgi:geranylgeranylglycerol-phosphate geranylgeranyltransferase